MKSFLLLAATASFVSAAPTSFSPISYLRKPPIYNKYAEEHRHVQKRGCDSIPDKADNDVLVRIYNVAKERAVSDRVMLSMFETCWVESHCNNLPCGDQDSVGVMQQRTSQGWGSTDQIMNIEYSATKYLDVAVPLDKKESSDVSSGRLAQMVQVSDFPDRYEQSKDIGQSLWDQAKKLAASSAPPSNPTPTDPSGGGQDGDDEDEDCDDDGNEPSTTSQMPDPTSTPSDPGDDDGCDDDDDENSGSAPPTTTSPPTDPSDGDEDDCDDEEGNDPTGTSSGSAPTPTDGGDDDDGDCDDDENDPSTTSSGSVPTPTDSGDGDDDDDCDDDGNEPTTTSSGPVATPTDGGDGDDDDDCDDDGNAPPSGNGDGDDDDCDDDDDTEPTNTSSSTVSLPTANVCAKQYIVKAGDTCIGVASKNGITLAQFYSWNSGLDSDCQHLEIDQAYCVKH